MDYYHREYEAYFKATVHVDPSPFLGPVVEYLAPGAEVWDVGCGAGRDLLWLKQRGFNAVGLERSRGLVRMAGQHSGCRIIKGDFTTFDFSRVAVDGILLTGALVHVRREDLAPLLTHITAGVKPGGILFLSLKQGNGISEDTTGRSFYLWQEAELKYIFHPMPFDIVHSFKNTSLLKTDECWLAYVLKKISGSV
ncbi:class I SAM-dependent methyltransferase [Desulfocicer niacini]